MGWEFFDSQGRKLIVGSPGLTGPCGATGFCGAGGGGGGADGLPGLDGSPGVPTVDPRSAVYPKFTVGVDSDEFDDGVYSGWTTVEDSPHPLVITESNDVLSVSHPGGDSAANFHGIMKAHSFATNDWIETSVQLWGRQQNYSIVGLVMSDGVTWGAGNQVIWYWSPSEKDMSMVTIANWNSSSGLSQYDMEERSQVDIKMRLKYEGSNHWRGYVSPDGISWIDISGQHTRTLTPTHAGLAITTWGGGSPFVGSFRYVKFGNG